MGVDIIGILIYGRYNDIVLEALPLLILHPILNLLQVFHSITEIWINFLIIIDELINDP